MEWREEGRGVALGFERLRHQDSVLFWSLYADIHWEACVCVKGLGDLSGLALQGDPG